MSELGMCEICRKAEAKIDSNGTKKCVSCTKRVLAAMDDIMSKLLKGK